jgi:hypothetical protein
VPVARQRAALWTTRTWPGALLVREIVRRRRSAGAVAITTWRRLSRPNGAVEAEATSLPLPGLENAIVVSWA